MWTGSCRSCTSAGRVGQNDGNDQSVETKRLTEDENQNDTDEDILLGGSAHTCITSNTDSKSCRERRKTAAQARGEVLVPSIGAVAPVVGQDFSLGRDVD